MMNLEAYTINAFTRNEEEGGNPAGVVVNANNLNDKQMLQIAREIGFSETAFVQHSDKADFKVQFFTPAEEVDLCGHATIGTFSSLFQLGKIKASTYTQETKAGILGICIKEDGTVYMDQNPPIFSEIIERDIITDSLGIKDSDLFDFPIQVVSTGLRDIIIPIKSKEILMSIQPDFEKVKTVSKQFDTIGYHLFCIGEGNITAYCRNLAPRFDIDEEAATGSANGALACYLDKQNMITSTQAQNLVFRQGDSMNIPSQINVTLKKNNQSITHVCVGGNTDKPKQKTIKI